MVRDLVAAARSIVKEQFPGAVCAFALGDWQVSEQGPGSCVDGVVLMNRVKSPHRQCLWLDAIPVNMKVFDLEALDLALQKDRVRGDPTLLQIVAQGEVLLTQAQEAGNLQQRARTLLAAGPEPLQGEQLQDKRHSISMLLHELQAPRGHSEAMGSLSVLHETLADFYLRSRKLWSASGSAIPKALQQADADFAKRWTRAFTSAFMGDRGAIRKLAEDVLQPFGGSELGEHVRRSPEPSKRASVSY